MPTTRYDTINTVLLILLYKDTWTTLLHYCCPDILTRLSVASIGCLWDTTVPTCYTVEPLLSKVQKYYTTVQWYPSLVGYDADL